MPNILDSIQVSGSSYDIKDKNAPSVSAVTQQEYDNLPSSAKTSNTFFVITDATPIETSGFVQTSAITSSVTSASTDSQIPTAKAVWEAASGGGSTYTAGRGIDITSDTISVSLPISAGTSSGSIQEGYGTKASGGRSHAEGFNTQAKANSSHAEGYSTIANNHSEHASGRYNVSSSASTEFGDSGNTLFSVGNGTANNARHNAFEIRQNGDIYLTSGGTDIKLQDHLGGSGGGGTVDQSVISGSTNAVSGGAVYTQLGGLKLQKITQSAYDALATKDANTLYAING